MYIARCSLPTPHRSRTSIYLYALYGAHAATVRIATVLGTWRRMRQRSASTGRPAADQRLRVLLRWRFKCGSLSPFAAPTRAKPSTALARMALSPPLSLPRCSHRPEEGPTDLLYVSFSWRCCAIAATARPWVNVAAPSPRPPSPSS